MTDTLRERAHFAAMLSAANGGSPDAVADAVLEETERWALEQEQVEKAVDAGWDAAMHSDLSMHDGYYRIHTETQVRAAIAALFERKTT